MEGTCSNDIIMTQSEFYIFSPILPAVYTWPAPRIIGNSILVNAFWRQTGLSEGKMITSPSSMLFKKRIWSRTGQRNNVRGKKEYIRKVFKSCLIGKRVQLNKLNVCWIDLLFFAIFYFLFLWNFYKQHSHSFWAQMFTFCTNLKPLYSHVKLFWISSLNLFKCHLPHNDV